MNKKTVIKLIACGALSAATVYGVRAQNAPATPAAPGNNGAGRGFGGPGGFGRGPQEPPGPPAPVPAEVAMSRPTPEEVAKMNADLKKFIESSSDKELLRKYESLLTVQIPRENPCIRPASGVRTRRHQAFVDTANTGDFDVLFYGDSITDQGVLWGLKNGEGQGHKPKAVMLMIGTNNTGGSSGAEIAEGIGADILELRKDFPDAKILLLAIFPRGSSPNDANRRKCEEANKIIAKLDDQKHVFFMNINSKFLDDKGGLIGFRTTDNLHPVEEGFEIWASAVAPTLKSWVK